MERAGTRSGPSESQGDGEGNVISTLRSVLRKPGSGQTPARLPERLLDIGWGPAPDLRSIAAEVVSYSSAEESPDEGPFDAIVWAANTAALGAASIERIRRLLAPAGRLVLRGRNESSRPSDAVARHLVRRLSEAGFVVLKELDPEALGFRAGAIVAARRDDFVVRPYRPGDGEAIRRLFVESFHVERPGSHWRWKYHDNPYGNRFISLAFSPTDELAVHYAGYPMPFWCDGRSFLGLHMGDTMTAPDYRHVGRGVSSLLARTVRHFFAIHRRGPSGFFYGFNTGGIQRFCDWFIGGSRADRVHYRVRELSSSLPRPARGYRVRRVRRLDRGWDRFFHRVAPDYGFLVRRDARHVDWRYLSCPDGEPYLVLAAYRWGRLVGWSVFRRKEDRAVWGDALFDPRHVRVSEAILDAALQSPELEGTRRVTGWFPDRPSWWDAELRRLGFETRPEPDDLGFMILPDNEEDPPLGRIYYTMGDGDLF